MPKPETQSAASSSSYNGTSGDDLFIVSGDELANETIRGRAGYDTLQITSGTDYTFDSNSYRRLSGVEEIDFTQIAGALSIQLDGSMLRQADDDALTMVFADTGPITLEAKAFSKGTLYLDGSGTVDLSDNVNNTVALSDGSTLEVHGGAGDDTITAGGTGNLLNGGAGNDTLVAGGGADDVRFAQGFEVDTVIDFDAAADTISLEGFAISDWGSLLATASESGGDTTFNFGNGDSLVLQNVALGDLSADNFSIDGQPLPDGGPPTVMVAVGTSASALNAMIAGAEDGTTFVLATGNHVFDQSILIERDNVSLVGEAGGDTTVIFSFPTGTGEDGIVVQGAGDAFAGALPLAALAGDTVIQLSDGHGFQAGHAIYLQQPNTQEYLDANGWTNVSMSEAEFRPFRESIHIIDSVNGNTVTLATPLAYDLEAVEGRYYTMDLVSDVTLSDFAITYDLGTTDTYDFTNPFPEFEGTSALLLNNTSGVTVTNLAFSDVASTALNLSSTIGAVVDNVSIHGAHNKGGGGNGYGVELHEAFNNTLTNLDIFDVRHSVVLSAWHAEVGNQIHVANTNRDVNLHGSPDYDNVIQVDSAILDYDVANGGPFWSIVSAGGTNHALTDPTANTITFGTGIGSEKNDTIKAHDQGSVLAGNGGDDTLIGGSGDDVLAGGTRRDTMTGGEGADTFLLVMGDDLDRITDFEFGPGGDMLIFSNNPDVMNADDLTITEDGSDLRVHYGSNSTVILENTTLADFDVSNFQFDPDGLISVYDFI